MKTKTFAALTALLLVAVLAFGACSAEEKIVGTWKAQQTTLGVVTEVTLVLNEDGTGSQSGLLGIEGSLTYTLADGTITIKSQGILSETTKVYTYTLKGDTLTLTEDSISLTYTRAS